MHRAQPGSWRLGREVSTILLVLVSITLCPAGSTAPLEDCAFKASVDGSEQRDVQVLPAKFDPSKEHHVLIVLHGHGSDRWQSQKLGVWAQLIVRPGEQHAMSIWSWTMQSWRRGLMKPC